MHFNTQYLNKIGNTYSGFKLVKMVELPEIQCTLREIVHEESSAHILHLGNDDPENLFCLSFRTLPDSSNGVAHILEHTVLCGSKKFPVKDPFFSMNRRSLNTFMNALTGSDFTCYPAATQVPQDFYNLLDVYLDAVFNPNLNKFSFLQEGHRLEFENPTDPSTPLQYKGIVFNEMKGALSSPMTRLSENLHEELFSDLTYHYNSGGDPKVIPQLTFEQLKEFHAKYYHPSRCLFFFYGNLPIEAHLDFILKNTLNNVKKTSPLPPLPTQKKLIHPIEKNISYPIAPDETMEGKAIISIGWVTCKITQQDDLLALMVLDIVLMDTDASPLKAAILKSGLCKQVSASLDSEMSEVPFALVFKGCDPSATKPLVELVLETLSDIASKEISSQLIESALHQLEIYRSEITGDSAPYGLTLFMRSALLHQHGGSPEDGLKIHSHFESLRKKLLKDPQYLPSLIKKYLIDNPHRVTLTMVPDTTLNEREEAEEKAILSDVKSKLSENEIKEIINTTIELSEFQEKQENQDLNVLPKITLSDVPKNSKDYLLNRKKIGNLELFHHNCFTNQIAYVDLVFPFPEIEAQDQPWIRLLSSLISQVGCGGRNYVKNLEYIQEHTGGVGATLSLNVQARDYNLFYPSIQIQGKALYRKLDKLFPLLRDIVTSIDFSDKARLKELVLKLYTNLESSLNSNALKYAMNLSGSSLTSSSALSNSWYGLEFYWAIKSLVKNFDEQANKLIYKLNELKDKMLGLQGFHLVMTCDENTMERLIQNEFYGLSELPTKNYSPWKNNIDSKEISNQGRIIASPVAFIAKVVQAIPYVHPDSAALSLSSFIIDNTVLHQKIREQGGAYGAGSSCNILSGSFSFYSYRDPNIAKTYLAFEEAVETLSRGEFEESDLEEAKLELIQVLDSPVAPGSRGETAYGWWREGRTLEMRQAFRNKVLSATCQQVSDAVLNHLKPQIVKGKNVVFATKELIEKENPFLLAIGYQPLPVLPV